MAFLGLKKKTQEQKWVGQAIDCIEVYKRKYKKFSGSNTYKKGEVLERTKDFHKFISQDLEGVFAEFFDGKGKVEDIIQYGEKAILILNSYMEAINDIDSGEIGSKECKNFDKGTMQLREALSLLKYIIDRVVNHIKISRE